MSLTDDQVAQFVERQRTERVDAGLTPTITNEAQLRVLAAVLAGKVASR